MNEDKRHLKVNLEDLKDAFDGAFDEMWHYLDLETGDVILVTEDDRRNLKRFLRTPTQRRLKRSMKSSRPRIFLTTKKPHCTPLRWSSLVTIVASSRFPRPTSDRDTKIWKPLSKRFPIGICANFSRSPFKAREPFDASKMYWPVMPRSANGGSDFVMNDCANVYSIGWKWKVSIQSFDLAEFEPHKQIIGRKAMHLPAHDVERFYRIWFPLLYYVNQQRHLVEYFPSTWGKGNVEPSAAVMLPRCAVGR